MAKKRTGAEDENRAAGDRRERAPDFELADPEARVYVGDCREELPRIREVREGAVDLVFADPPFNWKRGYDEWDDDLPVREYLDFTYSWIDLCIGALRAGGSLWINIPDDWAAEIVVHLKQRRLKMINWCIWHYRFGQNRTGAFINSKVHTLYFLKGEGRGPREKRTWNPHDVLEQSDRASTYFDPRTLSKRDGMPAGLRVPMDVWYGQYWGRVQGNSRERRGYHDNQLPEVYLERVIACSSNPGDLVLDPFLGSGTTGVMAHAMGRRFIGTEYSAANARSAVERMKAGPVRPLGGAKGMSSAIFAARRAGPKARDRMAALAPKVAHAGRNGTASRRA
ncbi:MAG: site-specific DNA-methyltransferase [Phycisphaerales bacterium]